MASKINNDANGKFIGCITGTSVDGLDLALLSIDGPRVSIENSTTVELPTALRKQLLLLGQVKQVSLEILGQCDAELGIFIGNHVNKFIDAIGLAKEDITAIGSHGQTVRHRPDATPSTPAFTMQIGDANRISEITSITTVADFRRRDMAAGGQGAPLVPPFHRVLFADQGENLVVVNIGGISNVSVLGQIFCGFDTGPGNGLMDAWCFRHTQNDFDHQGAWAASGTVDDQMLAHFLTDPYFSRPPPKSTGREYFNLEWLEALLGNHIRAVDVQATLAELTVASITQALQNNGIVPSALTVVGGGRLNSYLMSRLKDKCDYPVQTSEEVGIDGDGIEAAAFAWLAAQTIASLPASDPAVTGAIEARILGAIYPSPSG